MEMRGRREVEGERNFRREEREVGLVELVAAGTSCPLTEKAAMGGEGRGIDKVLERRRRK